jgi:hypothetical protein
VERFRPVRASLEHQIFERGKILYERQTEERKIRVNL